LEVEEEELQHQAVKEEEQKEDYLHHHPIQVWEAYWVLTVLETLLFLPVLHHLLAEGFVASVKFQIAANHLSSLCGVQSLRSKTEEPIILFVLLETRYQEKVKTARSNPLP
jgi:hypothetical protein